ncbi:MAG: hypothetical protein ISS79_10800 [Phycisphaerae bacterium]|nr:hypothetical protein [Phycisphaerae bacterium]
MESENRIRKLRRLIEGAFDRISYPGDNNISDEYCCEECHQIANALRGRSWKDVTFEYVEGHQELNEGFSLLSPGACRYFLPAFLIMTILHYWDLDMVPLSLTGALCPNQAEPNSQFLDIFEPLTTQQKRAVRLFLEYLLDEYPEEYSKDVDENVVLALERYWADK